MHKRVQQMTRWRVVRLDGTLTGEFIGTVEAPTVEEAINEAIREYRIAPNQQSRLRAYPWS
jgi:hypothetical protein